MGRLHVDPLLGLRIHPAVGHAAAWKDERVRAVRIDDGQLEIALEWRSGDRLPHWNVMPRRDTLRFDPDQKSVAAGIGEASDAAAERRGWPGRLMLATLPVGASACVAARLQSAGVPARGPAVGRGSLCC